MGRYRRPITDDRIEKLIEEGRGQNHGSDYKPWLDVRDVPSDGKVVRVWGWTSRRTHQLLSSAEEWFFYILDWSQAVTDIREQYPLLPRESTVEIANRLGIRHPVDIRTKQPIVMTSDFLIDFGVSSRTECRVRSIKRSKDQLSSGRTIEKLEIERTYWKEKGVDWGIVTEGDMPVTLAENVRLIHKFKDLDTEYPDITQRILTHVEQFLLHRMDSHDSFSELCLMADEAIGLKTGTSLTITKHFIASRRWEIDMNIPIDTGKPLILLNLASILNERRRESA